MTAPVADHTRSGVCQQPVAGLLRAEVAELDGSAATELAGHVRSCDRCQALARSILSGYEALDNVLGPPVSVDAKRVVARARARANARVEPRRGWRWPTPIRIWAAAGAGFATIATALLFALWGQQEPQPEQVWQRLHAPAASSPLVTATNHNVAVIQTGNPDITIFWYFKE